MLPVIIGVQLRLLARFVLILQIKGQFLADRDRVVDPVVQPPLQVLSAEGIFNIIVVIPKPVGVLVVRIQVGNLEGAFQADLNCAQAVLLVLRISGDIERVIQQTALGGVGGYHRFLHVIGINRHFVHFQIERDRVFFGNLQFSPLAVDLVPVFAGDQGLFHRCLALDGDVNVVDRMIDVAGLRHRGHRGQIHFGGLIGGNIAANPVVRGIDADVFVSVPCLDVVVGIHNRALLEIFRMLGLGLIVPVIIRILEFGFVRPAAGHVGINIPVVITLGQLIAVKAGGFGRQQEVVNLGPVGVVPCISPEYGIVHGHGIGILKIRDLGQTAVAQHAIVFIVILDDQGVLLPVAGSRRRSHHRARDGEAALLIGNFRAVVGHGDIGNDLGARVGEVDHVQLGVAIQLQRVLIGDGHLHGGLGLHLLAVLDDFDVKEPGEGHGRALNAQLGCGLGQIALELFRAGLDLAHLQLRAKGNLGGLVEVHRDFVGPALDGLVIGFQGIAQHELGEVIRPEGKAGHALQAVRAHLAVELQGIGQVRGHVALHLIQLEIGAHDVLVQVHRHVESLILLRVHVRKVDVEHAAHGLGVLARIRHVQHLGGGRLAGGHHGLGAGLLGQVHVVHGADDHGVVLRAGLGVAIGGDFDGDLRAVRQRRRQGVPGPGLAHGAQGPVVLGLFQPQCLGIGDLHGLDPRREAGPFAVRHDLQRLEHLRQRHFLRAADGIFKRPVLGLGRFGRFRRLDRFLYDLFSGSCLGSFFLSGFFHNCFFRCGFFRDGLFRYSFFLSGIFCGSFFRGGFLPNIIFLCGFFRYSFFCDGLLRGGLFLSELLRDGLYRHVLFLPIGSAAGERLDLEGHAVDDHGLALGAGQHLRGLPAVVGVGVGACALFQAAGQLADHGVAGAAMGMGALALRLAAGQCVGIAGVRVGMRAFALRLAADQHVLVGAVGGVLVLLCAGQAPLIAALAMLMARGLLQATGQRAGVAVCAVLMARGLLQTAGQLPLFGIAALAVLVASSFLQAAHQALFLFIAGIAVVMGPLFLQAAHQVPGFIPAILVVFVVVFALNDAADQFAVLVSAVLGMLVGRKIAHIPKRPGLLRAGGSLRQHRRQVCRNQHQQRQQQRHAPPRATQHRAPVQVGIEAVFHFFFLHPSR